MNTITTTEIVAYNEFRAQIAELKEYNKSVVFDYTSKKGNQAARSHIHKLRRTKGAVDACRKHEKAASLAYGRKIDSEAKAIVSELEDMIAIHQKPLDDIEQRERVRVDTILNMVEEIRGLGYGVDDSSVEDLQSRLDKLRDWEITGEAFQEFAEQATGARQITTARLEQLIAARKQADKKHRAAIENEAVNTLLATFNDMNANMAKAIVTVIKSDLIPHVSIKY